MSCESLDLAPRQPAIAPENLLLPNGLYANKYSLQQVSFDGGLPVPEILTEQQLAENDIRRREAYVKNPDEFYSNYWQYEVYCRGYFEQPVDMWAVDTLPTNNDYTSADKRAFQKMMKHAATNPSLKYHLKTNFDLITVPEPKSYLQRAVPEGFYFSTLTRGDKLFCTFTSQQRHRESNWLYYSEGRRADYSPGVYKDILEYFDETLLPLMERANTLFDQKLQGTFDYKHDFQFTTEGTSLLQSRVASLKTDEQTISRDIERIAKLKESGLPQVHIEIGDINKSAKIIPKKPYILAVTNNLHVGKADLYKINFSNMKGLCLPRGLRGGLLQHNGYNIIANALYWGLPIAFV